MTLLPCNICGLVVFRLVSVVDLLILLCFPVSPSTSQSSLHSSYVVISTKLGQVRGRVVQATRNETCQAEDDLPLTTQFLGVPYALPPVGRLRFQESRKNNGWILQGVLNATVPRERCPVRTKTHHLPTDTYDDREAEWNREDCLYMNIYVPGNLSSTGYIDAMELPVLVIFSEEEQEGAQEDALSQLASYGHIVIIDLSYRSGVLSYLSISGEKFTVGNNGFLDQRLAILWIWDNVREFGGNPEEITIFAEHRASISLGYHILQPDSRGLFARAVMHSGTPLSKEYVEHNHSTLTFSVVNAVGCGNSTPEDAKCLQSVALHKLLKAAEAAELNHTSWRGHMADPKLVPSQVVKSLEDGRFIQVDLLIGSSEHDGLCVVRETNEPEIRNKISKTSMKTFIKNAMKGRYGNTSKSEQVLRTVVDAVLFEYSSSCNVRQNLTETVAQLLTDMVYRAPAEWTARLASRHDNNVYLYVISSKNYSCSSLKSLVKFTECEQKPVNQLAKNVMDFLVNFVRKGNPNPLNGFNNWRPFTEQERYFLQFTDDKMHLKQSIRHRKMAFWNDYFPYLLDSSDVESCQPDDVVPNSSVDDDTDEETIKILLVVCFLVVLGVVLLSFVIFILMRLHRSHPLSSRHRCCFRCCKTGQRQNRHDLIMAVAVPDDEDHKLHPLPYSDESAWN